MAITKKEWGKVGKGTVVSIFIGGGLLLFFAGREVYSIYSAKKIAGQKQELLDNLKATFKTASGLKKSPLSDKDATDLIASWNTDLQKLSPDAFTDFMNFFNATILKGKNTDAEWNYQKTNGDDFQKLKDAVDKRTTFKTENNKIISSYEGTGLMDKFYDYAKNI